jgi:magnesium transporter
MGAMIGSGLPLLLKRAGMDPAVSSTPFIASLSDVMGLLIYYEIATLLVL